MLLSGAKTPLIPQKTIAYSEALRDESLCMMNPCPKESALGLLHRVLDGCGTSVFCKSTLIPAQRIGYSSEPVNPYVSLKLWKGRPYGRFDPLSKGVLKNYFN